MKRNIVLFFLLGLCYFSTTAENIGVDVGAEIGFRIINKEVVFELTPLVQYENSFGAFDIYAEAQYSILFGSDIAHEVYLEQEVAYNLPIGPGLLLFILYHENTFYIPEPDAYVDGIIEPSILYAQEFSFGELFGKLGFPITYKQDFATETFLTAGYYNFGFGIELTGIYNIVPDKDISGFELLLNYETDLFYVEVETTTNKTFDLFTITPEVEIYLNPLIVWAGIAIENIGENQDVFVKPYIGARYKF